MNLVVLYACTAAPAGDLTQGPPGAERRCLAERGLGFLAHTIEFAFEPGGLRAGDGDRNLVLELPISSRHGLRLIEQWPHLRVAASGPHRREYGKSGNPRELAALAAQHLFRNIGSPRQVAAIEMRPGFGGQEPHAPQLETVLRAVLGAPVDDLEEAVVDASVDQNIGEVEKRSPNVLVH